MQKQKWFWDCTPNRAYPQLPGRPTLDQVKWETSPENPNCPLNQIIVSEGNRGNMRVLRDLAYAACSQYNHSPAACSFAIFAQSGQGKSFIVEQWVATLGIPCVRIQGSSARNTWDIFETVKAACEKAGYPITPWKTETSDFTLPPLVVFWDEAHEIPNRLAKGDILPALEGKCLLTVTEPRSKQSVVVDCSNVAWIFATTEKGRLFHALLTRCRPHIEWNDAPAEIVAKIVKQKMDEMLDCGQLQMSMPEEACLRIACYYRIPREARDFAVQVVLRKSQLPSYTWDEAIASVAEDLGVYEGGLTRKHLAILQTLSQRPMAESRLGIVARCQGDEITEILLPQLMSYESEPLVVPLRGRGVCVTEAGLAKLEEFGISHNGHRVTAEYFEARR